ncbi:MAG: hypothetical protein CL678_05355 [Bdellovibrionaceae bacterium]|nr:hypothetical protein [Pseudobdellovibrionaceae bacterium]|tara:strand:+ start:514 stop:1014 length:501 start_codon:yes stop_codon:yes gene_type:complete
MMNSILKKYVIIFLSLFLLNTGVQARELQGRIGVGYNSEFSNTAATGGVPGVSIKYGLTRDFGIAGIFGMSTADPANTVGALKFFLNFFYETNLNFYLMFAGGLVTANNTTAAEFLSGPGVEFFIPGLESVGFSFETGIGLTNLSGSFAIRTLGVSILNAGVHFYF